MPNIQPKDIIAIVILVGIGVLKAQGVDGNIDVVLALIVGYYFGHRKSGVDNGSTPPKL